MTGRIIKYSIIIIFNFIIYEAGAQLYNLKDYNVENGFPQSNANHIFQDSKGFIWFQILKNPHHTILEVIENEYPLS